MRFKSALWYPIAVVLSVANLVAVGLAASEPEPYHVAMHAALALGFGLWAQRMRDRSKSEVPPPLEGSEVLEALEAEVSQLRQELGETQERLDFAERVLARGPESRRMDPQP